MNLQISKSTWVFSALLLLLCSATAYSADRDDFNQYWYNGQAEITRYQLEQARYGEIRQGDAVLIFVTENFIMDKQVKYEYGANERTTTVLKLNFTKKFYTGIYPYSIMSSIFTPVDHQTPTLKVTSSSQEWCGQTFMQLNHRDDDIHVLLRSYFQREGDREFKLDSSFLEDEIWTKIRLAPGELPTGEIDIIPGTQFSRLKHVPLKIEKATAEMRAVSLPELSSGALSQYSLDYKTVERQLVITFETAFPYKIVSWEERYASGFGSQAKILTPRARRTHSIRSDYWSKNKLSDSHLREELGIIY
jgi:hypothetical protein